MNPSTPPAEPTPSHQLRQAVFGGSRRLRTVACWWAATLLFACPGLTHGAAPIISQSPLGTNALFNGSVTFTVTVANPLSAQYQWRKDGENLALQTSGTLTLSNLQPADSGDYSVRVSNADGQVVSQPARLRVGTGFVIPPALPTGGGLPAGYALEVASIAGKHFRAEQADELNGVWMPWLAFESVGVSITHTDHGIAGTSRKFYRVVELATDPLSQRGRIVSSAYLGSQTAVQLNAIAAFNNIPFTALYNVSLYRITYETVDVHGQITQASGALALPAVPTSLPLLSYQHGTQLLKSEVASTGAGDWLFGCMLASRGYAVALPDYLGLGSSPLYHPYLHARSEATAAVDLLRAARTYCSQGGIALNTKLFLCGYSQGGHATMALHRELQTFHAGEFTVTAAAPMSGSYDLSGATTTDFLSGRSMPNPYYFSYILKAYREIYHLAETFEDLLAPAYQTTLPTLLDGTHDGGEVDTVVPAVPLQILKSSYLQAFQNDTSHPFRRALKANDVYEWVPTAPVRLYYTSGDQDVTPKNSQVAYNYFSTHGANVLLLDPSPGADHSGGFIPSFLAGLAWFDSLK